MQRIGLESVFERRPRELFWIPGILFTKKGSPFRMAQDHKLTAEVFQHRRRHFSCKAP